MFKKYLFCSLLPLLLIGCANIKPIEPTVVSNMKDDQSKIAVAFFDGHKKINYLEDKYLVLAVAQVASNSTYDGIWESNQFLTNVHTKELSKAGINTVSIYDVLDKDDLAKFQGMQEDVFKLWLSSNGKMTKEKKAKLDKIKNNPALTLDDEWRQKLIENDVDYLFWVTWSGFTLHMQTLGLPVNGKFATGYRVFDLNNNTIVWDGSLYAWEEVDVVGDSGKTFLEANNLEGLKKEVKRILEKRYNAPKNSYKSHIGLDSMPNIGKG